MTIDKYLCNQNKKKPYEMLLNDFLSFLFFSRNWSKLDIEVGLGPIKSYSYTD